MRKARSIERTWSYLMYEFYGGALPGSGADRPRLPELKSRTGFKNRKNFRAPPVLFRALDMVTHAPWGPACGPLRQRPVDAGIQAVAQAM
jgi:hypothetical protein